MSVFKLEISVSDIILIYYALINVPLKDYGNVINSFIF
jgi:hypothetical protein